jgi:hypothetical protein
MKQGIQGEYLFLWLSAFGSIILYLPLFLWYLGLVSPDHTHWYGFRFGSYAQERESSRPVVKEPYHDAQPSGESGHESDDESVVENQPFQQAFNQRPDLGATIW